MKPIVAVSKLPLKSEVLKEGVFQGEIIDCYAKEEWGRVFITMRNEDLVVAKADWLLRDKDGRPVEGGVRAFNRFAVSILDVEDLENWQDIEQACHELIQKRIVYRNTPQFGEKTGEYYNRFSEPKLLVVDGAEHLEAEPLIEKDADTYDTREQIRGYPYLYRLHHISRETNKLLKVQYYFIRTDGRRSQAYNDGRECVKARDLDRKYAL